MKPPPNFLEFNYIFINEDSWRFFKMDNQSLDIFTLAESKNNIMKTYGINFEKISKLIEKKYL